MSDTEITIGSYGNMLARYVSDEGFQAAHKRLLRYVRNADIYRPQQFCIDKHTTYGSDVSWQGRNMRRWYYDDCTFDGTCLREVGFTGSKFVNCRFIDVDISHSIFDSCTFQGCTFSSSKRSLCEGASFCEAQFQNVTVSGYRFHAAFFSKASFEAGSSFNDVELVDIVWESASFNGVVFDNVRLSGTNIEFTKFLEVDFRDTLLPFASIPFAYGAISYLRNAKHPVLIRTDGEFELDYIDQGEFLNLIPDMETFYRKTNNYFPLANILVEIGNIDEAFNAIECGIRMSILIDDLRLLKRLCLLTRNSRFSNSQRSALYDLITDLLQHRIEDGDVHDIFLALHEIRDLLLNNRANPYVTFEIKTNIDRDSFGDTSLLLKHIDETMASFSGDAKYAVELRHNCPWDFLITAFPDLEHIYFLISSLSYIITGSKSVYDWVISRKDRKYQGPNGNAPRELDKDLELKRQQFAEDFKSYDAGSKVVASFSCNAYNATIEAAGSLDNCTISITSNGISLDKA